MELSVCKCVEKEWKTKRRGEERRRTLSVAFAYLFVLLAAQFCEMNAKRAFYRMYLQEYTHVCVCVCAA